MFDTSVEVPLKLEMLMSMRASIFIASGSTS